jgi:hypothetical protein
MKIERAGGHRGIPNTTLALDEKYYEEGDDDISVSARQPCNSCLFPFQAEEE